MRPTSSLSCSCKDTLPCLASHLRNSVPACLCFRGTGLKSLHEWSCFISTSNCRTVLYSNFFPFSRLCCNGNEQHGNIALPVSWAEASRWVWRSGSSRPVGGRTTPPRSGRRGRSSRSRPHRKRHSKGLRSNEHASTGKQRPKQLPLSSVK